MTPTVNKSTTTHAMEVKLLDPRFGVHRQTNIQTGKFALLATHDGVINRPQQQMLVFFRHP